MSIITPQLKPTFKDLEMSTSILADNNHYYLGGTFKHRNITPIIHFIISKNLLPAAKRPDELTLIINSPGGNTATLFALTDVMRESEIPIKTVGLGEICSCGLLLFMAGTNGHRFVSTNTSILSHQYSWGSGGKHHELMSSAEEMGNMQERMVQHYVEHTGLTEREIKKDLLCPTDVWLTAEQAIEYGLADHTL